MPGTFLQYPGHLCPFFTTSSKIQRNDDWVGSWLYFSVLFSQPENLFCWLMCVCTINTKITNRTNLWFVTRMAISEVQSCSFCVNFPGYVQSCIICFGCSFYRWLTCWKSGHHDRRGSHVIRFCRISYQSFCHLGGSLAAR